MAKLTISQVFRIVGGQEEKQAYAKPM